MSFTLNFLNSVSYPIMGAVVLASSESMGSPTGRVADRYSSLFTLPSKRKIFTYLFALSLLGGIITLISRNLSLTNLFLGLVLGTSLFFTTLFTDYLSSNFLMRSDPVLNLRRCSFLSIPSSFILYVFASAANVVGVYNGNLWIKIISAGFFAALTFRLFVFSTVSSVDYGKRLLSALLHPILLLMILSILPISEYGFGFYFIRPVLISIFLASLGIHVFVSLVDAAGEEALGIRSLALFKAFLANWTENLNEPLEHFFEKLGEERDVRISLLGFKTKKGLKTVVIVPVVHPGPFKNVGSSPLPHMIQSTLEEKLKCPISVPHGISGHDLDLASQLQNEKILSKIVEIAEFKGFDSHATPFVHSKVDGASASCQIFGDCALFTLTLAPETMEDLPRELDYAVLRETKKNGLTTAITIDAHNSIQGTFHPERAVKPLSEAAVDALKKALSYERHPLEVGAAKVNPKEFSIRDGMGLGGINVIIVKVGDLKTAYVTIDGNNMISNLREKILSRLKGLGITEGEVLTTDTHVVNGVVKVDRGYYSIGEAIDQKRLIDYIEKAASDALKNLELVEFSWREEKVSGIKVIGEKQLNDISLSIDRTLKRAKKTAMFLFPTLAILLIAILILL